MISLENNSVRRWILHRNFRVQQSSEWRSTPDRICSRRLWNVRNLHTKQKNTHFSITLIIGKPLETAREQATQCDPLML